MTARPTLYSMPSSGNSYKIRLLLAHLGMTYDRVDCENATPELAEVKARGLLPQGKLPVFVSADGTALVESNAILWHLARGSDWIPKDPLPETQMLAWMFFEQNRHEPVIAIRASIRCYADRSDQATPERLSQLLEQGHAILGVMDDHLQGRDWFVGDAPSLADIALYAYTHSAATRGGYALERFAAVGRWLNRFAALPGHIALDHAP